MAGSRMKMIGIGCAILVLGIMGVNQFKARQAAEARAHDLSMQHRCKNNLRMLDMALEQAALSLNYKEGNTVTEAEVSPYLKGGFAALACPKNGRYTIKPLGKESECSVHGSVSTMKPDNKPVVRASARAAANARSDAMYEEAVREGMRIEKVMAAQSAQASQKKPVDEVAAAKLEQDRQAKLAAGAGVVKVVAQAPKTELEPPSSPKALHRVGAIACFAAAAVLSVLLVFLIRLIWQTYRRSFD
jgi:hypothetical protein